MSNRVLTAIERRREQLARGVKPDGTPITGDMEAAERSLDNTFADHAAYQTAQSRAHATGKITTDEAMTIYMALGEVPAADGWAAGTDLATKIVVTQVIGELIGA